MWGREVSTPPPPGNINKRYLHGKISENAPRTLINTSRNFALILFNTQRYKEIFVRTLTCNERDSHVSIEIKSNCNMHELRRYKYDQASVGLLGPRC